VRPSLLLDKHPIKWQIFTIIVMMLEVKEEVERGVVFLEKLGLSGIFSCLVELNTDIVYILKIFTIKLNTIF
jgi:hypothetical protein